MIGEGTDVLSQGEMHITDLMNSLCCSMPLNLLAIQRVPKLRLCLHYGSGSEASVASPVEWFEGGTQQFDVSQKPKTWMWDSQPAAAIYCLEELGLGRCKRHDVLGGIVLVPRLKSPEWFRRFARTVDVCFVTPAGSGVWRKDCHEPLHVGLCPPLLQCSPWDWRRVPFLVGLARRRCGRCSTLISR
jgi:hypothetical protein